MKRRNFLSVTTPAAGSTRLAELKRQAQQRQQAERALASQLLRDHLKALERIVASDATVEDAQVAAPFLGERFNATTTLRLCEHCGLALEVTTEPPPDVRLLCAGCYLETARQV